MSAPASPAVGRVQPAIPNRYGYTTRHVRCDRCLIDFLPQHVHRVARFVWWCDDCILGPHGGGTMVEPEPRLRFHYDRGLGW